MPYLRRKVAGMLLGLWSMGAMASGEMTADLRLAEAESLEAVARAFLPEAEWQHKDAQALQAQVRQVLADGREGGASVFLPDADTGPLSNALLVVLNEESELPHVRYRLRYARASVDLEGQSPLPVELVEVARFNLGPARRTELVEMHGEERVAPAEVFGQGPDVAWRFVSRPIMGQMADITHAARHELPDEHAERCLGLPCRDAESLNEVVRDWPEPQPFEPEPFEPEPLEPQSPESALGEPSLELSLMEAGLERLWLIERDERGRARWRSPEWPESASAGEPFIEVSLERGLGQDDNVDVVIHHDQLMDHEIRALWQRLIAFDTGPEQRPLVWVAQEREFWPRPE
ncbi:hypothetical protein [Halomonas daqiaonensis]|uniref:Ca-activated chloride channel family protein n=1 Tax=Halomonas daqiaonensis TaxID=650850 RepID=A0A1H7IZI1_9GAMM|nr:hypothetical protein [Halomonas daqiaonensis]SEK66235.1 Ca-activated chloride channel family protein [Halomonas daqiaonensis]